MLVPMWEHLFDAAVGHDSSQAALADSALTALAGKSLGRRLLLAASGQLPVLLRDSVAVDNLGFTNWISRVMGGAFLLWRGYPAAQIELNRRLVALAPHDSLTHYAWEGMGHSWAARGAWDSALVAFDHSAATDHRAAVRQEILPLTYEIAVAGAWLGGLDTARASDRRAAALKFLAGLPPDSRAAKRAQARVAWADGMLAVRRRDMRGLSEARARLKQGEPRGPVHGALPRRLRAGTLGFEAGSRGIARRPRPGGDGCGDQ